MNKRIKKKLYKRFNYRTHSGYQAWWSKLSFNEKVSKLIFRTYKQVVKTYCHTIPLVKMLQKRTFDFVGEQQPITLEYRYES